MIFWILPLVILFFLFRKIDLQVFKNNLMQVNNWWLLLALSINPVIVMLSAARWNYLLNANHEGVKIRLRETLRIYWTGMPLYLLVPGGLGWDTYRVLEIAKRVGRYVRNSGILILEKISTLLSAPLIIILAYPLASRHIESRILNQSFKLAYMTLCILVATVFAVWLLNRSHITDTWRTRISELLAAKVHSILSRTGHQRSRGFIRESARDLILPFVRLRQLAPLFSYSTAIQLTYAVGLQIYFLTAGYEISFMLNLVIAPILYLALLLPVTVGGIGVREVAYVLLYAQVGVPMEVALLVSFLAFASTVVSYIVGGLLFFHGKASRKSTAKG